MDYIAAVTKPSLENINEERDCDCIKYSADVITDDLNKYFMIEINSEIFWIYTYEHGRVPVLFKNKDEAKSFVRNHFINFINDYKIIRYEEQDEYYPYGYLFKPLYDTETSRFLNMYRYQNIEEIGNRTYRITSRIDNIKEQYFCLKDNDSNIVNYQDLFCKYKVYENPSPLLFESLYEALEFLHENNNLLIGHLLEKYQVHEFDNLNKITGSLIVIKKVTIDKNNVTKLLGGNNGIF